MKKLITTAMLLGIAWATSAQDYDNDSKKYVKPSTTETNFSMPVEYVNVRDFVHLSGKSLLVIELNNPQQYTELKAIDETLKRFIRDIAFYKDSLENGTGSVRIDYALDETYSFSKIRFKKHPADGEIFMNQNNDVARLKLDQDTVRIFVRHNPVLPEWDHSMNRREYNYTHQRMYQLTFCVNSYTDIAKIVADNAALQHAFDTLYATKKNGAKNNPYKMPSSSRYNPFGSEKIAVKENWQPKGSQRLYRYGGLWDPNDPGKVLKATDYISSEGNLGMGLVRNTLAPYAELGFTWEHQMRNKNNEVYTQTKIRAYVSTYFIFERNASNEFKLVDNFFVNADVGEGNAMNMGLGYLISGNNPYFKGTTGKVFFNVRMLKRGLTLTPELVFTNNFKEIYPMLTLKVL